MQSHIHTRGLARWSLLLVATLLLMMQIAPVYAAPVANPDTYFVVQDTVLNVPGGSGLIANDSGLSPLNVINATAPAPSGGLTVDPSGSFIFTPVAGFTGIVTFSYTVQDASAAPNTAVGNVTINVIAAPVANPDTYSTAAGQPLVVGDGADPAPAGVLVNDTPSSAFSSATPANPVLTPAGAGTVLLNNNGSFSYVPAGGFTGVVTFQYTFQVGVGNATTTGTVTITVIAATNTPVPGLPIANPDTYNTPGNVVLDVPVPGVLANDVVNGAGTLTAELITNVTSSAGNVQFNANGSFRYTPLLNFIGVAQFTYLARRSSDNVASAPVTVTINVGALVTATPAAVITAVNDTYNVTAGTLFSVPAPGVLSNDTSTVVGQLTAVLVNTVTSGSLTFNTDGSFIYTSPTGFTGTVTFTYQARQGTAVSNLATVTLNISPLFPTATPPFLGTATPLGTPAITALPPTFIPLFIPGSTPVPQPVPNGGATGQLPVGDVTFVVNRDGVNVRLFPAIGAEVIGFVNSGFQAPVRARSADGQWLKIDFSGEEGWIGVAVLTILSGNVDALIVEDPRTIPYGGWGSPRAGLTNRTSAITGRLADSGVRVRSGPSRAYVVLANAPRYTVFSILGRTFNNAWFQVNFDGVLGWVIAREVELQNANFTDAPIDGIVADALPISEDTTNNYVGTLQLLLDRLNLAQASLDDVRQRFTDAALTGALQCGNYPPRPTGYSVANPLAAAFYDTLVPVVDNFNSAMANLRNVIDILIDVCTNSNGVVGQGSIQVALEAIAAADGLFTSVRARLTALIPLPQDIGPEDCPFTFARQTEVLPRIQQGQLAVVQLNARRFVVGFCVDATAGTQIRVEILTFRGNARPVVSISAYDNPTNFLGVGRADAENDYVLVGPIQIDRTGVYLIVLSDLDVDRQEPLDAQVALLVTNVTGLSGSLTPGLSIDPATGQLIANPNPGVALPTVDPALVPVVPGLGTPGAVRTIEPPT
ncbi:MAG: Ig-like domain-containing protein [Chloroflexota bacterium]|nr:Ig-like domain-containing protein [Chloroflexota bacterium]